MHGFCLSGLLLICLAQGLSAQEDQGIEAIVSELLHTDRYSSARGVQRLIELDDPRAAAALRGLIPRDALTPNGVLWLAAQPDALADLVRVSRGSWADSAEAAGLALGERGGEAEIVAVSSLLELGEGWNGRAGFVRGLGRSDSVASLRLLTRLAYEEDWRAIDALGQRGAPGYPALDAVMRAATNAHRDRAARLRASHGDLEAVRLLAERWAWRNARAFVDAPIRWPEPSGPLSAGHAWCRAVAAEPELGRRSAQVRSLDGRWYVVAVAGNPDRRGHFVYAILSASGQLLDRGATYVRR